MKEWDIKDDDGNNLLIGDQEPEKGSKVYTVIVERQDGKEMTAEEIDRASMELIGG